MAAEKFGNPFAERLRPGIREFFHHRCTLVAPLRFDHAFDGEPNPSRILTKRPNTRAIIIDHEGRFGMRDVARRVVGITHQLDEKIVIHLAPPFEIDYMPSGCSKSTVSGSRDARLALALYIPV